MLWFSVLGFYYRLSRFRHESVTRAGGEQRASESAESEKKKSLSQAQAHPLFKVLPLPVPLIIGGCAAASSARDRDLSV